MKVGDKSLNEFSILEKQKNFNTTINSTENLDREWVEDRLIEFVGYHKQSPHLFIEDFIPTLRNLANRSPKWSRLRAVLAKKVGD